MKYMITWKERSQGSAIEYEKAQQRILTHQSAIKTTFLWYKATVSAITGG